MQRRCQWCASEAVEKKTTDHALDYRYRSHSRIASNSTAGCHGNCRPRRNAVLIKQTVQ
jgi:hypothetical protein